MTFDINVNVPFGTHDPADDVTPMRTNYSNIKGFLTVDHVAPGATNNGKHKQVTLPAVAAPGGQTGFSSVLYNLAGVADATASQLTYKNSLAVFPISCIRAWAFCSGAGAVTASQAVNCTVARTVGSPTGDYTVAITPNATSSANYAVLITPGTDVSNNNVRFFYGYTITSATSFRIRFAKESNGNLTDPTSFSFQVLQI